MFRCAGARVCAHHDAGAKHAGNAEPHHRCAGGEVTLSIDLGKFSLVLMEGVESRNRSPMLLFMKGSAWMAMPQPRTLSGMISYNRHDREPAVLGQEQATKELPAQRFRSRLWTPDRGAGFYQTQRERQHSPSLISTGK